MQESTEKPLSLRPRPLDLDPKALTLKPLAEAPQDHGVTCKGCLVELGFSEALYAADHFSERFWGWLIRDELEVKTPRAPVTQRLRRASTQDPFMSGRPAIS